MLRIQGSGCTSRYELVFGLSLLLLSVSACQPAANTNANGNTNNAYTQPANSNTGAANANANSENAGNCITINAREPEKYSATLVFSIETEGGDKAIGIPSLSVAVARNGDDRRVEFKLPRSEERRVGKECR